MKPPDQAIELQMPPGDAWAVGVSGGADSVALLLLLRDRPNLRLHVVHLNHQLRGAAAEGDSEFVRDLANHFSLPCDIARRAEIEPGLPDLPANPSARYRAIRLALFRRVVVEQKLSGVMLAHHRDDVAETVLHRLVRGSGYSGLRGMSALSMIEGLHIARPLLHVGRETLREFLGQRQQPWRQDASNESDDYLRNRLRRMLARRPALTDALLELSAACRKLADWADRSAPRLEAEFPAARFASVPPILARTAARRWLVEAGSPPGELSPAVLARLVELATDAATPHAAQFPGGLAVHRRAGIITSRQS